MTRILIAGSHRYADLARLWYRSVTREVLPALERAHSRVEVIIYCDAEIGEFDAQDFPAARLVYPNPAARDFIEFYDAVLSESCDLLLLLDADVFILNGSWLQAHLDRFETGKVAAVSFLYRDELPGTIYALACRVADFRRLPGPVFAPRYENLGDWPRATHRDPGAAAVIRLQAQGKSIFRAPDSEINVADFHGTTNLRRSRELFGSLIGEDAFANLVAAKSYFIKGAYDNLLLGELYRVCFGGGFAADRCGMPLAGSMTLAELDRVLERIHDPARLREIGEYCKRSVGCMERLAARQGVAISVPRLAVL